MITRKRGNGKSSLRSIGSKLGAVRLSSVPSSEAEVRHEEYESLKRIQPLGNAVGQVKSVLETPERPNECHKALVPRTPPQYDIKNTDEVEIAAKSQENPWEFVQDAFRRLADGKPDSISPLSLDLLVQGRPALLDKGLGAINAVGKAAVQVANSLDHAVEHLFEGWNVPPSGIPPAASTHTRDPSQVSSATERDIGDAVSAQHAVSPWNQGTSCTSSEAARLQQLKQQRIRKIRPVGSHISKENVAPNERTGCDAKAEPAEKLTEWRVKHLQEELKVLQEKQNEYMQLREQLNKVQAELTYTSNKCSALSQENELLREHSHHSPCPVQEADPLAEQVAAQLQALLQEKAKLASENARLAHENTSLQELLEFTVLAVEKEPCSDAGSCHASEWDAAHELEEHIDLADDPDRGTAGCSPTGSSAGPPIAPDL